ncbi:MAG TPA: sugar transferase [Candidatus Kapabacteria bacterium]|jgi:lipopolysaccharide/colanic/teichoic acid biosynthesis glycosyltransferase|nr:sugar transferase [Candidatus Kapabacteria bacterium]
MKRSHSIAIKRAVDLLLAIPLSVLAVPIVLISGLAIFIADPGPIIIVQSREGLHGKTFRMWKLRTMYRQAADILARHIASDASARVEWETYQCFRHDPRVLPFIGKLLRRTSIDELPQLWNVLKGEMSLVGPRPFPLDLIGSLDITLRGQRATVLPGMTGLWQVSGRGDIALDQLQKYDLFYVNHWTPRLDLWILSKTIPAVIRGKGAY